MQIVVTGGLDFDKKDFIRDCLIACIDTIKDIPTFHVRNYPRNPDQIVKQFCQDHKIPFIGFPRKDSIDGYHQWDVPGENKSMLVDCDLVLAFPGGAGTTDCKTQASVSGIHVIQFTYEIFNEWKKNARYRKYKL